MSTSCFICLETFHGSYETKRLCSTCQDSTICNKCEQNALKSENPDILTHCPLCRKFLGYIPSRMQLMTFWHPLLLLFWNWRGIQSPLWEQFMVLALAYGGLSETCKRINAEYENHRPSLLLRRWNLFNTMIHLPYLTYMGFWGDNSRDGFYNTYLAGYLIFPLLSVGVLKSGLYILQRIARRRNNT